MPLQLACINENHIAVVQYLIDRGADVNAQRYVITTLISLYLAILILQVDGQKNIVQTNRKQLQAPQGRPLYMLPVRMDAQKL